MNANNEQANESAAENPANAWDRLVARVIEPFDQNDVCQRWAVEQWRKHAEAEREGEPLGNVVHKFASDEVLAAAIAFFQSDIEENIAIFKARVAKNRRYEALVKVRSALGLHDGVFPNEDESIDVERLAVIRNGRDEEQVKHRKLVEVSRALAEAEGDPEEVLAGAQLPGPLRENEGVKAFLSDLVEFIGANGERGRDLVSRVCADEKVASRVKGDDDMPKPLRFLAGIAIDLNRNEQKLPVQHRPLGFGAGSAAG
jgi:hypothetical protein